MFLFGDVFRPVGLILNHDDPSECFVLFPSAVPMQDIYSLSQSPSGVGAHMQLIIKSLILVSFPLLLNSWKTRPWRRGRSMNISQLHLWNPKVLEVLGNILLPKEAGTCCHCLGQTVKIPRVTETSANHVCYLGGDEKADRMPLWVQYRMCHPSFRHY